MFRFLIPLLVAATLLAADEKVTLSNGVQVTIHTSLGHPTGTTTITTSMVRASGDSFYRVFRDQNHLAVFAYELRLGRAGDHGFVVTAHPAMQEFATKFPGADAGKPVPSLSADQTFNLDSGQSATIPVFSLEGQGLEVIDTVQLVLDTSGGGGATDGVRFSNLHISINGSSAVDTPNRTVSGKYAMFYIPGRGGYFFSTVQASGFLKAGSIQANAMQFTIDNELYQVASQLPISARGELWVYHDPNYRPEGNWTQEEADRRGPAANDFFTAASGSLDWWLQKPASE